MRNRYSGKCAQCLNPVGAGAGSAVRWGGRWVVLCAPHARTKPTPARGTAYRVRDEHGGGWLYTDDATDAAVDAIRDGYIDY
jgi:hypothetical protein